MRRRSKMDTSESNANGQRTNGEVIQKSTRVDEFDDFDDQFIEDFDDDFDEDFEEESEEEKSALMDLHEGDFSSPVTPAFEQDVDGFD